MASDLCCSDDKSSTSIIVLQPEYWCTRVPGRPQVLGEPMYVRWASTPPAINALPHQHPPTQPIHDRIRPRIEYEKKTIKRTAAHGYCSVFNLHGQIDRQVTELAFGNTHRYKLNSTTPPHRATILFRIFLCLSVPDQHHQPQI
jgi:hypothetical protein